MEKQMGQVTVGSRKEARDLKYAGDEAAGCHSPAGVRPAYMTWRHVFFHHRRPSLDSDRRKILSCPLVANISPCTASFFFFFLNLPPKPLP